MDPLAILLGGEKGVWVAFLLLASPSPAIGLSTRDCIVFYSSLDQGKPATSQQVFLQRNHAREGTCRIRTTSGGRTIFAKIGAFRVTLRQQKSGKTVWSAVGVRESISGRSIIE